MSDSYFKGKTIVVTGAGQGIGRDVCERLYDMGADVFAISRSLQPLLELQKGRPKISILQLDLSNWSSSRDGVTKFLKNIKVDGLVNNAGLGGSKSIYDLDESDFDNTININLKAVFNVTQTLLPNFNEGASIVNLSSQAGLRAFANHAVYSASKAGVDALSRAFALELGPRKIRVNSVNPTVVLTEMSIHYWTPERGDPLKARIPLNRFCELNEVTDAIVYLLSDKSSFINGHSLPVEGGFCSA
ncbi:L-xylulose reductase-like [Bradysia coprophila]|uniref:L-xylulose reductase-like n=1 Tax=Bradysia coprophila TaxID=38358 RepID=UPI00187DD8B2|nr:L-xylulose reductase-like [Bradysia coprophila]